MRTLSQAKAFGATHSSVAQADNSKGLSEIQPSIAANRPLAQGKAAVVPLHSVAPLAVAHHAPLAHHGVVAHPAHHGQYFIITSYLKYLKYVKYLKYLKYLKWFQ